MRLAMCKMGRLDRVAGSKGAAAAAMFAAFKVMVTCVITVVAILGNGRVVGAQQGSWQLLVANSGLSSMHTAVTRFNTVVFLERTNQGATSLKLPGDWCHCSYTFDNENAGFTTEIGGPR